MRYAPLRPVLHAVKLVNQFGRLQAMLQALIQGLNVMLTPSWHDSQSAEKASREG